MFCESNMGTQRRNGIMLVGCEAYTEPLQYFFNFFCRALLVGVWNAPPPTAHNHYTFTLLIDYLPSPGSSIKGYSAVNCLFTSSGSVYERNSLNKITTACETCQLGTRNLHDTFLVSRIENHSFKSQIAKQIK